MNNLSETPNMQPDQVEEDLPEVVYTKDRYQRLGARVWCTMVKDLIRSRGLVWRLFVRNWSAQYRQSWLGYMWAVVPPLIAAATFSFAVRHKVLNVGLTPIPYVCYALWGMTVWQLFIGIYSGSAGVLRNAKALIARINFPQDSLVFASTGKPLFAFAVRLLAVAGVFFLKGVTPSWTAIFAPFALFPIVLMGMGLGMIMAVISTSGNDLNRAVGVVMNFGMLLTPVIYPPPTTWPTVVVNILNPLSPVLLTSHELIRGQPVSEPMLYLMSCGVGILFFLCGWRIFRMSIPRIAERF